MPRTAAASEDMEAAAAILDEHRPMLYNLAYRLLGSAHDAEDVLQEAFLRWSRTDRTAVGSPRRYLSRVVTHLAMDQLRARQAARETYIGHWLPEPVPTAHADWVDSGMRVLGPLDAVERRETLSIAALHLIERLSPPERAVYVLRTAFDLSYGEIADLLDRTQEDCRQLYHRAVRRMRDGRRRFAAGSKEQERLRASFLAAARDGDMSRLVGLLASDATVWSDGGGRARAARHPIRGADRVARFIAGIHSRSGPGTTVTRIELNCQPAVFVESERARYAMVIAAADNRICDLYLIANPDKLHLLGDVVAQRSPAPTPVSGPVAGA